MCALYSVLPFRSPNVVGRFAHCSCYVVGIFILCASVIRLELVISWGVTDQLHKEIFFRLFRAY